MAKIRINMLGEFSISYKDKTITEMDNRGSKTRLLIQYLIAHKDKEITQNELIELLWPDSSNPASALKTLVHRTRETLSQYLPEGVDMIINNHGSYRFNNDLDCFIDSDEFIMLCNQADNEGLSRTRRVHLYKQAFALYKGGYLTASSDELWVTPIYVYFQAKYILAVDKCAKLLYPMGKFTDIVRICTKATLYSPADEKVQEHLIRSMTALGEYDIASKQYEYFRSMLFEQYGTAPSSRLVQLYELTVKPRNEIQNNIDVIVGDLTEDMQTEGGYFCEYEVFRYIFRLYMRECKRLNTRLSMFLITLESKDGSELTDSKQLQKAMQKLSDCIGVSLRMRDVYTRYSRCQYILLLPDADDSSEISIRSRIKSKFLRYENKMDIAAKFDFCNLANN